MATTAKKATRKEIVKEPPVSSEKKLKEAKADLSRRYNEFKQFEGQQYTGMQVGRSHHWNYDKGDWKETKITPDLWEISYSVTKRRKGHAPEDSGVPVGTEYQWYILAHQSAEKLNANDYSTSMTGLKFKLAHKRADKNKWSLSAPTQRKHLVKFLKEMIAQLEADPVPFDFEYEGESYKGEGVPILATCDDDICYQLDVTLNDKNLGIIRFAKSGWKMDNMKEGLINAIGNEILLHYD